MDNLKTQAEIQRAHDALSALVVGQLQGVTPGEVQLKIKAQLVVLCWLLGHPAGRLFEDNLLAVDRFILAHAADPARQEVADA